MRSWSVNGPQVFWKSIRMQIRYLQDLAPVETFKIAWQAFQTLKFWNLPKEQIWKFNVWNFEILKVSKRREA